MQIYILANPSHQVEFIFKNKQSLNSQDVTIDSNEDTSIKFTDFSKFVRSTKSMSESLAQKANASAETVALPPVHDRNAIPKKSILKKIKISVKIQVFCIWENKIPACPEASKTLPRLNYYLYQTCIFH